MSFSGRYRHLDHTADLGIEAEAPDEAGLYATCARALFDIIAGEDAEIRVPRSVVVSVEAPDRELLLQRWLRELLYLHDSEGWLFASFEVRTGASDEGVWLRGEARGEKYEPGRHRLETELKAVTHHHLSVSRDHAGGWRARVIFDI